MSWWPKPKKITEPGEALLEGLTPRSTVLPPAPRDFVMEDTPRTLRVPVVPDANLAIIDAAFADDVEFDMGFDEFDEDECPTRRRISAHRAASPTLPCRVA